MPTRSATDGPVWVVLPTYNEIDNLEPIAEAIGSVMAPLGGYRILIVDDSSPDGTGELADRLAAADERIEVLHRAEKQGLGQAYLAGFQRALAGGAGRVIEMDADFSHDPAVLPRLVAATEGADLALGSRYIEGGGVSDWGPLRRLISRAGCLYAQLILTLPVKDLTGGFKCFRREVLEAIELDTVRSRGYAFQVELTYRTIKSGFRVAEVPITFSDRRVGQSKMSRSIVAEAIWMVPSLRFGRHRFKARKQTNRVL